MLNLLYFRVNFHMRQIRQVNADYAYSTGWRRPPAGGKLDEDCRKSGCLARTRGGLCPPMDCNRLTD